MKTNSTILVLSACYLLMLLTVFAVRKINTGDKKLKFADLDSLNYLHTILILVMLLASCIIKSPPYSLIQFPDKITIGQFAAFLISFGTISFFPWKKFSPDTYQDAEHSVQVSALPFVQYAFLRIVFLMMYEWFFRGLLLISFSVWLGVDWGIVVNILLYVILHAHKSKKEMLGCVPFGLLLCVFTIWWHSVWPAIIFHLQIAIINERPLLQKFSSLQKQNAL
jgi:membrane protease YdiL (CAAX protease family)